MLCDAGYDSQKLRNKLLTPKNKRNINLKTKSR